jgi:hypothetical protein
MSKAYETARGIAHYCPGCNDMHYINTKVPNSNGAKWGWDGNLEAPTVSPSVNLRAEFTPEEGGPEVCHYFLQGGVLKYCGDCTHQYSGKDIPLPELPSEFTGETNATR